MGGSRILTWMALAAVAACAPGRGVIRQEGLPEHARAGAVVLVAPEASAMDDGKLVAALDALISLTLVLTASFEEAATCDDKRAAAAAWSRTHSYAFSVHAARAEMLAELRDFDVDTEERMIASISDGHLELAATELEACATPGEATLSLARSVNIELSDFPPACRRLRRARNLFLVAPSLLPRRGRDVQTDVAGLQCRSTTTELTCASAAGAAAAPPLEVVLACFNEHEGYEVVQPGVHRWAGLSKWFVLPDHELHIGLNGGALSWQVRTAVSRR